MALDLQPLGVPPPRPRARWLAPLSIALASLVTIVPVIATVPFLPPFGLLMLLGWRLLRPDALRVWAAAPLGLFDDLLSGQPFGSAMFLWMACMLIIDVLETRIVWRNFWQDWLIAAGATGFVLIAGRFLASPISAKVDAALLLQAGASAMLFPLASRLCAWLDRDVVKA
ncbi:rod shape-determining protein MreD [Sphingomonas sp. ABOLD]|uniref:Rod shape-determining protein MreD n=1 Tax=Sphingomonas trueperi TaxID=53317 RepID=A0A7X5XYU5_9SPHN|nr:MULTISPECIES: rod shape-determining protein MreD [Sphingomonas]NJB97913.1 rod shape-determining protein MreD [Sphingomonas trueperi]RSV40254.1 rod shape-determining protein MreD [Sphingomonas sp. ABOLD]